MFETHLHTAETSACAALPAFDAVDRYHQNGYSGLVVTDHYVDTFFEGSLLPWAEQIDRFLRGYRLAKQRGAQWGMTVLLGIELRFQHNANDYLVYGITPEFLIRHPRLYAMDEPSFYRLAKETGLLVIQAHPFRDNNQVIDSRWLDGIEVFNGQPAHRNHNDRALAYAQAHALIGISGSDCHDEASACTGGIIEPYPIETDRDLLAQLRAGAFRRIS